MPKKTMPVPVPFELPTYMVVAQTTYRCNGVPAHEWKDASGWSVNSFALALGKAGSIENLCPHCLILMLEKLLAEVGRVEIVKEEQPK